MDLYINESKIDFTLEGEKTLAAVIAALESWLAEQKLLLAELKVNGEEYDQTLLKKNASLSLEAINEIRATATDLMGYEEIQVVSLLNYFQRFKQALATMDKQSLESLLEGFTERRERLGILFSDHPQFQADGTTALQLDRLFTGTTYEMIKMWDQAASNQAQALCQEIISELEQRQQEYTRLAITSQKLFKTVMAKLKETVSRLPEVSLLLQTGKDNEAMQIIISFTEMTQLFFQLAANALSEQAERDQFAALSEELNIHLKEILTAFQQKDYVLIGDLCEYELAPHLTELLSFAEQHLATAEST